MYLARGATPPWIQNLWLGVLFIPYLFLGVLFILIYSKACHLGRKVSRRVAFIQTQAVLSNFACSLPLR
jgi:choline-glycine betaine transporter